MQAISVSDLKKTFKVKKQRTGFSGTLSSFFKPDWQDFDALRGISFDIERGERVAFIGPNGAGKSTTIKILSGILQPTSGAVSIGGHVPWKAREKLAYDIGTVFGQRSQLWYHLPARDSFSLLASAYDVDEATFKKRINRLTEAFDIGELLDKPVRQMSLGQRMRCEIVASFIHNPKILFLDEPTVGLDVAAKSMIRNLVYESSVQENTTVLLTSHDTGDMERVCDRVILIDEGQIIIDGPVSELRSRYISKKIVSFATKEETIMLDITGVKTLETAAHKIVVEVNTDAQHVEHVIQKAMEQSSLRDISVEDPPMEEVIQSIYNKKSA